jgi:mono/diheme cytochrome c family protein
MKWLIHRLAPWGAVLGVLTWGCAQAQPAKVDFGKREFEARCASCHGVNAKGLGPLADLLKRNPPDLTQLAKNNGGILPMDRLYDSISGDTTLLAHGSRDMPVWGQVYRADASSYYYDIPYNTEAYVRARVLSLLEYINRLQVK